MASYDVANTIRQSLPALAAYTFPAIIVLNTYPPIAGDSPISPRFAPKCLAPNNSMINVGMAQN